MFARSDCASGSRMKKLRVPRLNDRFFLFWLALAIVGAIGGALVTVVEPLYGLVALAGLIILGKRHLEARRIAVELGIADHVIETGYVADEDLPRWLACADVCFLPRADTLINRTR